MVEIVWELASYGRGVKICKRKRAHFKTKYLLFLLFKCNLCSFFGCLVVAYCSMSVASIIWLA